MERRTVFVLIQETRRPYDKHVISAHSTLESAEEAQLEMYRNEELSLNYDDVPTGNRYFVERIEFFV